MSLLEYAFFLHVENPVNPFIIEKRMVLVNGIIHKLFLHFYFEPGSNVF